MEKKKEKVDFELNFKLALLNEHEYPNLVTLTKRNIKKVLVNSEERVSLLKEIKTEMTNLYEQIVIAVGKESEILFPSKKKEETSESIEELNL